MRKQPTRRSQRAVGSCAKLLRLARPPPATCGRLVLLRLPCALSHRAPRCRRHSVSEVPYTQPLLVLVLRPHGTDLLLMQATLKINGSTLSASTT